MLFKALIVDDEPLARDGLRMLLAGAQDVEQIYEAKNGREAVNAIQSLRPDLVFLDVQMPEMNGFDVIREIGAEKLPIVVFVTAHDRYAIDAFEINAIDYLLKPVTKARFAQTLERARVRLSSVPSDRTNQQILSLLSTITSPSRYVKRIAVRSTGKTAFVEVDDIDWIEAAENYVQLHTRHGDHLLHAAMNTIEQSLDEEVFLRIHRSIIVNVRRIKELQPVTHGEYLIVLQDGVRLQSSRMYNSKLKTLIANPF